MAGLWKNFTTSFGSKTDEKTLTPALNRATHSDKAEVSKDDLLAIVQSSHHEDDRRTIMRHLGICFMDTSSSKWRHVSCALTVVDNLLRNGSPDLITETASGAHFDIIQRLSFLDKFEYSYDKRVESMIKRKSASLRGLWLEKQQRQMEMEEKKASRSGPKAFHTEDTDDDLSDVDSDVPKASYVHEVSTTDGEMLSGAESSPRGLLDLETPRSDKDSGVDLMTMPKAMAGGYNCPNDLMGFDFEQPKAAPQAQDSGSLLDLM